MIARPHFGQICLQSLEVGFPFLTLMPHRLVRASSQIVSLRILRTRLSHIPRLCQFSIMATPPPDRRPIVISGPSGVGKGTLYNRLLQEHPYIFALSVSHTTRGPRPGEEDGVHYHFVTMEAFEKLIAEDGFIEHAKYGSNRYGTSKMTIEEQSSKGRVVLLDIEMEGVKQIKQSSISARFIFIAPPSLKKLEDRLRGRGTEKEESIRSRMAQAEKELAYAETPSVHDKIIVNDDLDTAYKELEEFVYKPLE